MRVPENFLYYLSMHEHCNEKLLARAKSFAAQELEVSVDAEARHLKKMVQAVMGEVHRMKAFVRLQPHGSQVLYGYLKPRNMIGEHIADYFARRTPGVVVVLGNGRESWTALCREGKILRDHGQGMAETLDRLTSALDGAGNGPSADNSRAGDLNMDELWQVYYDSQYCPERKNLAAFRQHMPERDQRAAGLRMVQNKREVTLEDFLDGV